MERESDGVVTIIEEFLTNGVWWGYEFVKDSGVRHEYLRNIQGMSDDLMRAYQTGFYSAEKTARIAHFCRNEYLKQSRTKLTSLGREVSKHMKEEGKLLEELMSKYSCEKFKQPFRSLKPPERNQVFVEIVQASGRDRQSATALATRLKWAGRVFWVVTAGVIIYDLATCENPVWTGGKHAATMGGGFAGGAAAGAVAAIWTGPVGIAIAATIGGILGAVVSEETYLTIAGPEREAARSIVSKHKSWFSMDEEGLAETLLKECGVDMDQVYITFLELDRNYNGDADDVVFEYVNLLRKKGGPVLYSLRKHPELVNVLIRLLDEGWTTGEEYQMISYLKSLRES